MMAFTYYCFPVSGPAPPASLGDEGLGKLDGGRLEQCIHFT